MKLQRINKYSGKKLLNSLKIILLSSTLLMGCNKVKAEEIKELPTTTPMITSTPIVTSTPTIISTPIVTNDNFWDISNEEIDKEISKMIIKNPDVVHNMACVQTVVTKDYNGDYGVISIFTKFVGKDLEVYDVFTEKYLFTLKDFDDFKLLQDNIYFDLDLSTITKKSSYFDDKEIVAMGTTFATTFFVSDYFNKIKEQIGSNFNYLPDSYYNCIYDREVYSDELNFTVLEIAKQYIKILPKELRASTTLINEKSEKEYNGVDYFVHYWKISDEERKRRLEEYDIKYPNSLWIMNQIDSIVLKDKYDNYKVLQVYTIIDREEEVIHFYDIFTEEKLFDLPLTDKELKTDKDLNYTGFDLSKIYNAIPYFNDKKIVEYGICVCSTLFVENHLNELGKRDGVEYCTINGDPWTYMYPIQFTTKYSAYTKQEIAENYVTTVPNKFRVTPKEMGLTITYKKEREYADFWKISFEEEQKRMDEVYLYNENDKYKVCDVKTLIVNDGNEKILNVILKYEDGYIYFYDLYSGISLFKIVGNKQTDISRLDFSNIEEAIPFFKEKNIIKSGEFDETYFYIYNNIDKYRKRDGINYEIPEDGGMVYLTKYGKFSEDSLYTVKQYATCYVTIVREENQVPQSELMMGLEKEKVLVKQ